MRRFLPLSLLLVAATALAQSYPFPFANDITWGPHTVTLGGHKCVLADAGAVTSDPLLGGNATVKITCSLITSATTTANLTVQLIGSSDVAPTVDGGTWVPYQDGGTVWSVTAPPGGAAYFGWAEGNFQVFPDTALQESANFSDGGAVCCVGVSQ